MKMILKISSGAFYGKHSRWTNDVLHRSAFGREGLVSSSISVGRGLGFGFFSFSWNDTVLSRK